MSAAPPATCPACGAPLESRHRYCWRCGAPRPPQAPPRAPKPVTAARLRLLGLLYAAGAIFFLVLLAQTAAFLAAPNGRDQLAQQVAQAGVPAAQRTEVLTVYCALVVLVEVAGAALHALVYYTMRRRRLAAWAVATALAVCWSLVLVGIPVLAILVRRDVRQEFGLSP